MKRHDKNQPTDERALGNLPGALSALALLWCRSRELGVPDGALGDAGICEGSVQWLLDSGYAIRTGASSAGSPLRDTQYMITEAGLRHFEKALNAFAGEAWDVFGRDGARESDLVPQWRPAARELTYCGVLVKRFRKSAPNQECILDSFESRKWPRRISDPLPREADVPAIDRLRDAIKRLNRTLQAPLLRFGGDGTGAGVIWRPAAPPAAESILVKIPHRPQSPLGAID